MKEKRLLHSGLESLTGEKKGGVIVIEGEEGLGMYIPLDQTVLFN